MKVHLVWGDGEVLETLLIAEMFLGTIQALYYGTRGDFVNLGSGMGYKISELVGCLNEFIDFEYKFDLSKPNGFPKRVMDINRAREWIHYEPRTSLRKV